MPAKAREAFPLSAGSNGIGLDDLLRSYVGLLATGQSDYEAISNRREDDYFRESLSIGKIPSAETLRQRLDEVAQALRPLCDACSVEFLKKADVVITHLGYRPCSFGLRCFRHGQFQDAKEGVSRIYNGEDGYAPMEAYMALPFLSRLTLASERIRLCQRSFLKSFSAKQDCLRGVRKGRENASRPCDLLRICRVLFYRSSLPLQEVNITKSQKKH